MNKNYFNENTKDLTLLQKDRFFKKMQMCIGEIDNDDLYFQNEFWERRAAIQIGGVNPKGLHGPDILLDRPEDPLLHSQIIEYKRNKYNQKNRLQCSIDIPVSHTDTSGKYEAGKIIMHSLINGDNNLVLCDALYKIKTNIKEKRKKHKKDLKNKKHGIAQKFKITYEELELIEVIYLNKKVAENLALKTKQKLLNDLLAKWKTYRIQKVKRSIRQINKSLIKALINLSL